jgi:hypothetical protein
MSGCEKAIGVLSSDESQKKKDKWTQLSRGRMAECERFAAYRNAIQSNYVERKGEVMCASVGSGRFPTLAVGGLLTTVYQLPLR